MTTEIDVLAHALERLEYDASGGEFRWTNAVGAKHKGRRAGSPNAYGYRCIRMLGCHYMAHRLAWLMTHKKWPAGVIDHINGDRSDNRIENLRDVSMVTNLQNQRQAKKTNLLGILGVSEYRSSFRARIRVDGKQIGLGTFKTTQAASAAYLTAKRALHAGNTL